MYLEDNGVKSVIYTKEISKDYRIKGKIIKALENCSLDVQEGTSTGFVGLNGSGKSTTMKILTGIMKPTSGEVKLLGVDPFVYRKKVVKSIGVLFGQRSNLIYDLPVKDSFNLLQVIYDIPNSIYKRQIDYLGDFIDFGSLWNTPVRNMSLGQRMRCEVASVLLHNPKVVFFDEAFLGIDFKSKNMIRRLIDTDREKYGTAFFITSHDIWDIDKMCKDIIVINKGKIIQKNNIGMIKEQFMWSHLELAFSMETNLEKIRIKQVIEPIIIEEIDEEEKIIRLKVNKDESRSVLQAITQECEVISYKLYDCNLEEIINDIISE